MAGSTEWTAAQLGRPGKKGAWARQRRDFPIKARKWDAGGKRGKLQWLGVSDSFVARHRTTVPGKVTKNRQNLGLVYA